MDRPNLFGYDNYRHFLRDWYTWMKGTRPGFSYRAFSKWAGFKSPNQLLLVINGLRNIALGKIEQYTGVLKLKHTEKKYFELLVKFNQAKDLPSKTACFQELSIYWLKKGAFLKGEQFKYLTNWYFTAVREMVNLKGFKENGHWIAKETGHLISSHQANKALEVLVELGLLKRNNQNVLIQTSDYLTTGDEVGEVAAYLYHEQMMKLADDALKSRLSSERNLTALTFTMRKEDYESITSEISDFRKKIVAYLQNRRLQNQDDNLYQLNIHLFPIRKG